MLEKRMIRHMIELLEWHYQEYNMDKDIDTEQDLEIIIILQRKLIAMIQGESNEI